MALATEGAALLAPPPWDRINRPVQILQSLPEAMRVLATPELMGAVTICLPEDVQAEVFDFPLNFFEKRVYRVRRNRCEMADLRVAAELIRVASDFIDSSSCKRWVSSPLNKAAISLAVLPNTPACSTTS